MPKSSKPIATTRIWLTRGLSAVGVILLATVPALGLTVLTPGLISSGKTVEKDSSASDADVFWAPLTFAAPTTTLQLTKLIEQESRPLVSKRSRSLLPLESLPSKQPQASTSGNVRPEEIVLANRGSNRGLLVPQNLRQSTAPNPSSVGSSSSPRLFTPALGTGTPMGSPPATTQTGPASKSNSTAPISTQSHNADRNGREDDEQLEPLDEDLNKRKPRKPRKSPHK